MSSTVETATEIRPFRVDISEERLEDLRRRIAATRWPSKELVADRSQGVQLATIQELARYWATDYDWRACEARLNALAQFTTEIPHQCNPTTFAINPPPGDCPYTGGVRKGEQFTGQYDFYKTIEPNLHGVFGFAGDLPSLVQSGVVQAAGLEAAGVGNDGVYKGSASDTQAAFARLMQTI